MTDNEIIKALECCTGYPACPTDCPLYEQPMDCLLKLSKPTLDLINRQKAEIENWKDKTRSAYLINLNEKEKAEAIDFLLDKLIDLSVRKDNGDGTESLYVETLTAIQFLKNMRGGE